MNKQAERQGKQVAFAVLSIKEVDDSGDVVKIKGIASTPTTDRVGDKVNPLGAKFKTPMPLLLYHVSSLPVGNVTFAKATKTGIPFEAELPKVTEPGTVQDRVNEAIHSLKYKLIAAVSIGFNPDYDKMEPLPNGGWIFNEWEWLELSLVTIPANPDAVITGVKSFDQVLRAASGRAQDGRSPGVPGNSARSGSTSQRQKGTEMKTLAQLREERTAKSDRAKELVALFSQTDHKQTDDETTELQDLTDDIESIDKDIVVARFHAVNAASAKSVDGVSRDGAGASRGGPTIIVKRADPDDKFAGQSFVRFAIAKAIASKESGFKPSDIAQHRWGKSNPNFVNWVKANEVAGGGTLSGDWGSELVTPTNYGGDFITFLYGLTVYDKLALKEVPENILIKGQDGEATGYWVGEHKAIPATVGDFFNVSLQAFEVAGISVVSNKLLRLADPSAEQLIRDMLANAVAKRIDLTFLSADATVASVKPAGMLNGLTAIGASGTDSAALLHDLAALYAPFIAAKNASGLTLVMTPSLAKSISLMRNALGQKEFPDLKSTGGDLEGDPVVTGDNVPAGDMILLKPSDIFEIGDRGITVSISTDATIEQSSVPTGFTGTPPVAMSADMTSMFQSESTAIKVVRPISFAKRRASAVAYVDNAEYGSSSS